MTRRLRWKWLSSVDRCPAGRRWRVIIVFVLIGGMACSQSIVIERVTVIDATDRGVQPDQTVVIVGDRITAIGPWKKTRIPKDAQVLNAAGKFLIPGLWDMHVHGASDRRAAWSHPLFVANGVVGVRDMAGPADAHAWRAQHAGDEPRLNVYLGSPIVDGPNPEWPDSIVAANEAQGREVVDRQQQSGADFIKVYSRLPRGVYFAIAGEARRLGIPFEGHVPESVSAAEASDAGQKSIEHLTLVAEGCSREEATILADERSLHEIFRSPGAPIEEKLAAGKRWFSVEARMRATYDEATAKVLFARFLKNGTWQCPTLTLIRAQIDNPLPSGDPKWKYLSKEVRSKWEAGYLPTSSPGSPRPIGRVGQSLIRGISHACGTDGSRGRKNPGRHRRHEPAVLSRLRHT
jgi:hypothetical protein